MHTGREQHAIGALEVTCQPPRVVVPQVVRDYSDTSVRQGSAFGGVAHDRDHVLACPEQLRDSVTPDASRGSEDNDSAH
ncbi:MAG TPA: hypothetical protein VF940_11880 [Streptosporangiaceae bacterium]